MKCRKNVKNLSTAEKNAFVQAINLLKNEPSVLNPGGQNRYDDFVKVHFDTMNAASDWTHGDSAFFPWHRELLYQFELELDRVVPGVTIPYWDWTRHQESTDDGFPFVHNFIGVDGDDAASDQVEREPGAGSPYPYEFDPEDWDIVVKDNAANSSRLRRAFGERADAPNLPENDTAVEGVDTSFREALASTNYLQLRQRSEIDHHNLVHRWVGGNMLQASSPNDPVFFMHHAAIDRMWTIWQENNPALTPYVNTSGAAGHGLNDDMIFNFAANPVPWSDITRPVDVIDSHAMHADSIWYETDLPEIFDVPAPTLNFGMVPEGLTQYRAARFQVRACRPLRFRITGVPDNVTTNFDTTPLGVEYTVMPSADLSPVDVYVWFQFTASGPSPDASVIIEADFLDDEGYYAANEGDFFSLGTFNITLTAAVQPREDNAVVMVLDRSGSMEASAGGGSTRSSLMKSAVGVFHTLMLPGDEFGVVSFDDLVDDLLPLTTQGAGLGTTLTGSGLDPRGNTAIGQGIQLGSSMLASATHSNRSMIVLTDGNENVPPDVADLPAGVITNRTYAIGFGLPGGVSDMALNQITQNTGGDLVITGALSDLDEQFQLSKYFIQILAGVSSANVILDPGGELGWDIEHKIAFQVTETDIEIDVISLSAFPQIIEFWLETPSGDMIRPADAGGLPNIDYQIAENIGFYRLQLPALPGNPGNSHMGTWIAHLRLAAREKIKKLLDSQRSDTPSTKNSGGLREIFERGVLPYQVVVHARSNLDFSATLRQKSLEPGAILNLEAKLSEYGVPYQGSADIRAQVIRPDRSEIDITLLKTEAGVYAATITAGEAGIYSVRIRAAGTTSGGSPFTREKTVTASVFAGGDTPRNNLQPDNGNVFLCHLIECLLRDESVQRWMKRHELDTESLRKCVTHACRSGGIKHSTAHSGAGIANTTQTRLDTDQIVGVVRRELLATHPEQLMRQAADPVKSPIREATVERKVVKDRKELFQMSATAAEAMKTTHRKSKKPKNSK